MILKYKFVDNIPDKLENNVLYISLKYCTVVHKCICGCGNEVVTPLSPTDWKLTFNGKSVSLYPSIGNWGFECKTHYWIIENEVRLAEKLDEKKIEYGRYLDKKAKNKYRHETNKKSNKILRYLNRMRLYLRDDF